MEKALKVHQEITVCVRVCVAVVFVGKAKTCEHQLNKLFYFVQLYELHCHFLYVKIKFFIQSLK